MVGALARLGSAPPVKCMQQFCHVFDVNYGIFSITVYFDYCDKTYAYRLCDHLHAKNL